MTIFAIGDLHMPGGLDKTMDVFGEHWDGHIERIEKLLFEQVKPEDIVLIPGDISWAMQLREALGDLERIGTWPGQKVMIRGNHDYWWGSIGKMRKMFPEGLYAIQNDAICIGEVAICGTRGWIIPTQTTSDEDVRIVERECVRLKLSLDRMMAYENVKLRIAMLHFPPFNRDVDHSPYYDILSQYPIDHVVYGHLHGSGISGRIEGRIGQTEYHLASCDSLGFTPKVIDVLG